MPKTVILCVDDEASVLATLKEQLRNSFGGRYLYETAESAEEAWEVIDDLTEDDIPIFLIVSDWLMPEVRGDEFLIDVHRKFPRIVKIMLTGQADDDAVENVRHHASVQHCLWKPWDETELIGTIRSLMDGE